MQANTDGSRWQKWPSTPFGVTFMPTAHAVTAFMTETAVKRHCAHCFFTFTLAGVVFSLHQSCEPSLKSLLNNKDATTEQIKSPPQHEKDAPRDSLKDSRSRRIRLGRSRHLFFCAFFRRKITRELFSHRNRLWLDESRLILCWHVLE